MEKLHHLQVGDKINHDMNFTIGLVKFQCDSSHTLTPEESLAMTPFVTKSIDLSVEDDGADNHDDAESVDLDDDESG